MRITFKLDNTIQVFRLGKSANKKITNGKDEIVQTYTFSIDQYNYIQDCILKGIKSDFKTFFSLDEKNCFDCPFSSNSGNGKCYTHKFMQYTGFTAMLKSIVKQYPTLDSIPTYSLYSFHLVEKIVKMAKDRYVRFGTYGEPSMHPYELVEVMAYASKTWTGYTHQYMRKNHYSKYFMASTHNQLQAKTANDKFNYRSFIAVKDNTKTVGVICPASKEANNKANCADCGLCSGIFGKGKKDVVILEH